MTFKFRFRTFGEFIEKLKKEALRNPPDVDFVGCFREEAVKDVLQEMKERKEIIDFLPTSKFSWADVKEGVDFYVIVVGAGRRRVLPVSVLNSKYIEAEREKHPSNFFVGVNENMSKGKIRQMVWRQLQTIVRISTRQ